MLLFAANVFNIVHFALQNDVLLIAVTMYLDKGATDCSSALKFKRMTFQVFVLSNTLGCSFLGGTQCVHRKHV